MSQSVVVSEFRTSVAEACELVMFLTYLLPFLIRLSNAHPNISDGTVEGGGMSLVLVTGHRVSNISIYAWGIA